MRTVAVNEYVDMRHRIGVKGCRAERNARGPNDNGGRGFAVNSQTRGLASRNSASLGLRQRSGGCATSCVMSVILLVALTLSAGCRSRGGEHGRDLSRDGTVRTFPIKGLSPNAVRIYERENGDGGFDVLERHFAEVPSVVEYLRRHPRSAFEDGIVLVYSRKTAGDDELSVSLVRYCVDKDIDLFVWAPISEPGMEDAVTWVVESTRSSGGR